jgi:hypothetical protein
MGSTTSQLRRLTGVDMQMSECSVSQKTRNILRRHIRYAKKLNMISMSESIRMGKPTSASLDLLEGPTTLPPEFDIGKLFRGYI